MKLEVRSGWPKDSELRLFEPMMVLSAQEWATLYYDDVPVAYWGLLMRWPGVADLVGTVNPSARGNSFRFVRCCWRLLSNAAYRHRLRRVSAYVQAEVPEYRRFAELAGFVPESVMYQAGPTGGDVIVYVRTFPWGTFSEVEAASKRVRRPNPTTEACGRTTLDGSAKRRNGSIQTSLA